MNLVWEFIDQHGDTVAIGYPSEFAKDTGTDDPVKVARFVERSPEFCGGELGRVRRIDWWEC